MFTWLMQQPIVIIAIGLAISAGFIYGWMQTAKRGLIYAAVGTMILVTGVVLAEQVIETDEESIRRRLREIAIAVENNDHRTVVSYIDPNATSCRESAENEMPSYGFKDCYIAQIKEVEIDETASPRTARAMFLVWVYTTAPHMGFIEPVRGDRMVELQLREAGPRNWLITDYDHWDPRQHLNRKPAFPVGED